MAELLLVRYGELALKSAPVRREFEHALRRNILDLFVREGVEGRIRSDRGHLYVETDDAEKGARIVRRVFGVTSVSRVEEVPSEPDAIRTRLLELASPRLLPGRSFAVRARRTGQHPFTSQQLAGDLGAAVLSAFSDRSLTVDLQHPEVELFVEVRGPRTYLSFDRFDGPGGLPLGVAGHLVALVDGPRGALGAFVMMKRGCRVGLVVLPAGEPYAYSTLVRFDPSIRTRPAPPTVEGWVPVIADLAEDARADGVVLPIPVEEHSQFLGQWGSRVLFSPTVGMSDQEVEDRWKSVTALVA